ncbi:MAG: peptidylprolyl isomerase [Bryobacterales bacterium]|nr:peptidylprolyl isomerase [Bryobacteraceae bacterium]MDW8353639.1 peptidylprolyl isomerase [Bryobacterales bacterium]
MKRLSYALLVAPALASDVRVVEMIVAKVNNEIITASDLKRSRDQLEAELRRRGLSGAKLEAELKEREKDILRDRIDELLLIQRGRELNINVDPEVSKYLADIQLQYKIADQDKFHDWIREQTGMSFEDFKAEIKNNFLTRRVIGQEVGSKINIPRAEVEKYYNENKQEFIREERVFLREILVSTEGKPESELPALEKKAKDLVERARKGERFGELARDHSDAVTAQNLGELGWFRRADLNPQIVEHVFGKERGHVTDPIRIPNGFLILRVEEAHKAGLASLEEVQNEIMEKLYMPRFQPALRNYLTKLRMDAFLEIRDGYADTGAAPGKDTSWKDPAQLKPETVTKEEVAAQSRRRRLLWIVPIPGTKTSEATTSSSK